MYCIVLTEIKHVSYKLNTIHTINIIKCRPSRTSWSSRMCKLIISHMYTEIWLALLGTFESFVVNLWDYDWIQWMSYEVIINSASLLVAIVNEISDFLNKIFSLYFKLGKLSIVSHLKCILSFQQRSLLP